MIAIAKAADYPNQPIAVEKIGEDPATGKVNWMLVDENGNEHIDKGASESSRPNCIVDIGTVSGVADAGKPLTLGWEYKTP